MANLNALTLRNWWIEKSRTRFVTDLETCPGLEAWLPMEVYPETLRIEQRESGWRAQAVFKYQDSSGPEGRPAPIVCARQNVWNFADEFSR